MYINVYLYVCVYTHMYRNVRAPESIKILTKAFAITSFMLVASLTASTPLLTSKVPYAPKVTWYEQRHKVNIIIIIIKKKKKKRREGV